MVVPSDVDLTYKKAIGAVRAVLEKGGPELLKELSAIGYCGMGNAVITRGYTLGVSHVIFFPCTNCDDEKSYLDYILLHKALKNAFNLASLYGAQSIAIDLYPLRARRYGLLKRIFSKITGINCYEGKTTDEVIDIVAGIAGDYERTLKELAIYR